MNIDQRCGVLVVRRRIAGVAGNGGISADCAGDTNACRVHLRCTDEELIETERQSNELTRAPQIPRRNILLK
jgi:hypothetical protein